MSVSTSIRGLSAAALFAVTVSMAMAAPSQAADVRFGVVITGGPDRHYHRAPPARYERIPPPPRYHAERYYWKSGHWHWTGHRHVWIKGRYVERDWHHHRRHDRWDRHDRRGHDRHDRGRHWD